MDFSLTEEQELLLASIRELITTNFPEEYFRTCDQNGHTRVSLCGHWRITVFQCLACRKNLVVSLRITSPKCWR